jgi:putative Mn2+ efflux pump MntP
VLALLLVAVSLGLSNFAAAIGVGVAGVDARTRLRVGLIFGVFEAGMPILGLVLGHSLARTLGHAAHWIGAALLIATGLYALVQSIRSRRGGGNDHHDAPVTGQPTGRLLVTGAALSIDNLAVGFALGSYHVSLLLAAVVIGAVSVSLSLAGLELGQRLGTRTGENGEILGGLVLIVVGIAIAAYRTSARPTSYYAVRSGQAAAERMIFWPDPSTGAQPNSRGAFTSPKHQAAAT